MEHDAQINSQIPPKGPAVVTAVAAYNADLPNGNASILETTGHAVGVKAMVSIANIQLLLVEGESEKYPQERMRREIRPNSSGVARSSSSDAGPISYRSPFVIRYPIAPSHNTSVLVSDDENEAESPLPGFPNHPSNGRPWGKSGDGAKGASDIRYSHFMPDEAISPSADSPIKSAHGLAQEKLIQRLRSECPDPLMAGIMTEEVCAELFEFYFRHLNATVALLDSVLHTPDRCRNRSPLLFTAVLAISSRVIRPKLYSQSLLLANRMVGQAVEFGVCTLEVIQALCLLTHWKKADDDTSWVRVGMAIRMAQMLGLDKTSPRPLPRDEMRAREVLNRERVWLSDLSIAHGLPKMLKDDVEDPADWVADHPHLPTPGESSFSPIITFNRLCKLYTDSLESMNGDPSNMRMLNWMEIEWKRWRERWLLKNDRHNFSHFQIAALKVSDAIFRFHLGEYRLLFIARFETKGKPLKVSEPSPLSMAFTECSDAALGLAEIVQREFVPHGYLTYCFSTTWSMLAITVIWLVRNLEPMSGTDRARVIRLLADLQFSMGEASTSGDDMAAYTHRFLKHLLNGISPEWQLASFMTQPSPPSYEGHDRSDRFQRAGHRSSFDQLPPPPHQQVPNGRSVHLPQLSNNQQPQYAPPLAMPSSLPGVEQPSFPVDQPFVWAPSSAQELIQEYLWSTPQLPLQNSHAGNNIAGPSVNQQQVSQQVPPVTEGQAMTMNGTGMYGALPINGDYMDLFPETDDDLWKHLFPSSVMN
ncbi:hypothetical protein L198_02362 [Cryptococcus wingfieldii CBS 7118]|uniref:Xylanolytic transcriptional activator regulatory domain-containing protein n=1 Tax=Cryptococcus wingfieldii CBS 7118 TaxID=1295528 RepID=A0A1E3JRP7_9TREE|nr:hypothetical protein L198_02362 [Cryptococcus wingfieldii CBS 7118]ODO03515.1 hypothetical protein L198_02362 [Cryptococcus wingfieldii CBS 7118]